MRINFFEEFPAGLKKIKLVNFPTTIYVAAHSIKEYKKTIKPYKKKNIEYAYWPILKKEEGYWFSALTKTKVIERVIDDIKGEKTKILWDAELPSLRKRLFITSYFNIFANRKIIREFLKTNPQVVTAEYPLGIKGLFNLLALRHPNPKKRIYMMYSSAIGELEDYLEKGKKRIGVGVIAKGILGTEKPITPKQLKKDLAIAKKIK